MAHEDPLRGFALFFLPDGTAEWLVKCSLRAAQAPTSIGTPVEGLLAAQDSTPFEALTGGAERPWRWLRLSDGQWLQLDITNTGNVVETKTADVHGYFVEPPDWAKKGEER